MTVAGTLADLDLGSIASVTSLGRSSLRLELRETTGRLIGSLVFKAGHVVSASAGTRHGHDALRVLLRATRDTRFQLTREPLDFALSSSLASIEELGNLLRGGEPAAPPRAAGSPLPAARGSDAGPGEPSGPRSSGPRLQGQSAMADRPPRNRRRIRGASTSQLPTLRGTRASTSQQPTSMLSRASKRPPRPRRDPRPADRKPLLRGRLDQVDLVTVLQTISVGRQLVEVDVLDKAGGALGHIRVKSGKIVAAEAGAATGMAAINGIVDSPDGVEFAAFRVPEKDDRLRALASISELGVRLARGTREMVDRPLMEGALSEFDVATLLQTIAASRQHCAVEIHDGQSTHGRIVIKSGIVLSAVAGARAGLAAIEHLIATHGHERFRVIRLAGIPATGAPLGRIGRVLRDLERHRVSPLDPAVALDGLVSGVQGMPANPGSATPAPRPATRRATVIARITRDWDLESPTRLLRWVIPLSVFIGGAIVFLLFYGSAASRRSGAPTPAPEASVSAPARTAIGAPDEPESAPRGTARDGASPSPPVLPAPTPTLPETVLANPAGSPSEDTIVVSDDDPPGSPAAGPALGARAVQTVLNRLGYSPGPIDNSFGRLTRAALVRFQRAERLRPTGVLDGPTRRALTARMAP